MKKKKQKKTEKGFTKLLEKRLAIVNLLTNLKDNDGEPFFDVKWIKKQFLKI